MSKGKTKGAAKLAEQVAPVDFTRDGDDLVIRLKGAYTSVGIPTETGKDTRKLASTPGMFTWVPDGAAVSHVNPDNRRLGIKVTAILGSPRDLSGKAEGAKSASDKPMSAVNFG